VQLEPQEPEPLGERGLQLPGLFLGVAVDNNVIRLCRGPGYADLLADALVSELITAAGSA
jgi:5-formyltetrahydrofolate cyclo-ligase